MTVAPVVLADAATSAAILDVEERRRRALLEVDLDTLRDLYDDSLIHTHAPGLTHTKAQLLEHIATRAPYRGATRGELTIRVIGGVAIMTGRLINRLGSPDGSERTVAGQVIQVLRQCEDGAWRFVSFQMTPDGEHVWAPTAEEKAGLDRIAQEEQQ
ncbi:nuclear transport factor 2 family protein [Streptomyces castrisilvae]|uniref:Nuclear transport factor 2 family protein n=1 Tax=Streptomyces castrisilvae TaxID=3033811 RepID=A0ABY9HCV8_9ACTN|nr:nuclear transport factor 2 family protein [Streptomyces sp. Mut1]WLQ31948.1 nuclear transport factor 2 family protein [Streptomyces sp. Mut1]